MPLQNDLFKIPQTLLSIFDFKHTILLPEYTTANRPDPTTCKRAIIFVNDESAGGGSQFQASDGVAWRDLG